jgi:hypothetical protein
MFERLRQSLPRAGNRDEMHVIGHQAIAEQGKAMQLGIAPEQVEIDKPVGIAGKDDLPGVAALGYVDCELAPENWTVA